jgi:hypothetical protein
MYLSLNQLIRGMNTGIFERRGREGFAENAKEDKEKNSQILIFQYNQ